MAHSPTTTFVLIPGAWHGAWAWTPVAGRLRAAGHRTVSLTLPGLDGDRDPAGLRLEDAVDFVVAEIERRDLGDVTLVAHSWGGYPMTGAAHRLKERLSKIVYYNAMVPARGVSARDELAGNGPAAARDTAIRSTPAAWLPPLDIVQKTLIQDEPEPVQRLLWELLQPQPAQYGVGSLDLPDVTTLGVPLAYILSENDRGLGRPGAGADFARRLGVDPVLVPGTHESLLTHPGELAQALLGP
ncbi:alpha/beta fold hydrolase [Streptomyces liangshanensis]|uniref:Alpha/beta hydrolase n=1 Tax=Streptomyces liangshanensis TaxID=2717324 RepID=A0A6G9GUL1_9ACTN|nr:alpha/beta hydrolase [Streptomyces liangshanensis]QIQ01890.1 alpha/beta hydrolase [Streptomyces liangshanensis]